MTILKKKSFKTLRPCSNTILQIRIINREGDWIPNDWIHECRELVTFLLLARIQSLIFLVGIEPLGIQSPCQFINFAAIKISKFYQCTVSFDFTNFVINAPSLTTFLVPILSVIETDYLQKYQISKDFKEFLLNCQLQTPKRLKMFITL